MHFYTALEPHSCSMWENMCTYFFYVGFCELSVLLSNFFLFSLPRDLVNTRVFSANKIQFKISFILKIVVEPSHMSLGPK